MIYQSQFPLVEGSESGLVNIHQNIDKNEIKNVDVEVLIILRTGESSH